MIEYDTELGIYMSEEKGFNLELWNERWKNITDDVGDIKSDMANIKKMTIGALIGIAGWSLIQIYGQLNHSVAHAETPPVAVAHK